MESASNLKNHDELAEAWREIKGEEGAEAHSLDEGHLEARWDPCIYLVAHRYLKGSARPCRGALYRVWQPSGGPHFCSLEMQRQRQTGAVTVRVMMAETGQRRTQ